MPRIPSVILAVALVGCAALAFTAGAILDTVAKSNRKQWELDVYKAYIKKHQD